MERARDSNTSCNKTCSKTLKNKLKINTYPFLFAELLDFADVIGRENRSGFFAQHLNIVGDQHSSERARGVTILFPRQTPVHANQLDTIARLRNKKEI